MKDHTISKSQYVKGLQCPKALWLYRNRQDLRSDPTPKRQALFDTGHKIGKLAMHYFAQRSEGVEVTTEYWDVEGATAATEHYIKDSHGLIFEATAMHPLDGCYASIDILKRVNGSDEWDLIEVKSATRVKDYHIDDMSFQYHVFCGAGYNIRKCFMMLVDNSYVRGGDINPSQFFKLEEITSQVLDKQSQIGPVAGQLINMLEQQEPDISIGAKCFQPFECDYKSYCWAHIPPYSVFDVFKKQQAEEIADTHGPELENLPDHLRPTGPQAFDVESYLSGQLIIDLIKIAVFLGKIEYPLRFLNYETLMPAIPIFEGTRPYQQIPFQFSMHVKTKPDAKLVHYEYLHKAQTDPRRAFAKKLIKRCGSNGTILVYNQEFEAARNRDLAREYPEFALALVAINSRMIDLQIPFTKRWLYHPNQSSSLSIKAVLSAFTNLNYEDMEIGDGVEAMQEYSAFMQGEVGDGENLDLWSNLTEYCKQDTYAMVLLLGILHQQIIEA